MVEQLAGAAVPAAALESLILPTRVDSYTPAMLDELTAAGDVVWAGAGALPGGDGWLVLVPAALAPLLLPPPGEITTTPVHDAVLAVLDGGGALFFRGLADRVAASLGPGTAGHEMAVGASRSGDQAVAAAIWDLVWAGLLTNDTLAPLRTVLSSGRSWVPAPRPAGSGTASGTRPPLTGPHNRSLAARRPGFGRGALLSQAGPPTVSGRWSLLPPAEPDQTRRLHAVALSLLDRHGILIRGAAAAERSPGGFGALYPVLRAMEETGQCRRGYFVEGLGAAQFALPGAVDRMRAMADSVTGVLTSSAGGQVPGSVTGPAWPGAASPDPAWTGARSPGPVSAGLQVVVLAAADPASAYGAALAWPPRPDETPGGHRPGRKAGALVVLAAGQLVLYVERGGKTLLSWTSDPALLDPAAAALAAAVRAGALGRLTVERADGGGVYDSPLARALETAGFRPTPRGLRLRG